MMLRRLLTIASAFSLVLCVATCVLWASSHTTGRQWEWHRHLGTNRLGVSGDVISIDRYRVLHVFVSSGRAAFQTFEMTQEASSPGDWPAFESSTYRPRDPLALAPESWHHRLGFAWGGTIARGRSAAGVSPLWLPAAILAVLPVAWVRGALRRRRKDRRGLCPMCGYDLTGNVSGVCPECGSPAKGAA